MRSLSLILIGFLFMVIFENVSASQTIAKVHISHWYPETVPEIKTEYELELAVWGENISSVTAEGPNVPLTNLEYEETEDTQEWRMTKSINLPGRPSVGDTYSFHVTYNDLTTENLTASVSGIIDEFPTIISPVHGTTITTNQPIFEWSAISIEPLEVSISVFDPEIMGFIWMAEVPKEQTSIEYNFDGEGGPLQSGKSYFCILEYRDSPNDNAVILLSAFTVDEKVGVGKENNTLNPLMFHLSPNYPNPFNPITTIEYSIPQESHVTLAIYNASGQTVGVLKYAFQTTGNYSVMWNAEGLPTGLYFCTLRANAFTVTRKMVLVK